jgi:hypothetical protein
MLSMHDVSVRFLGGCECGCHLAGGDRSGCWCSGRTVEPHPYRIGHNDAVTHFGGCPTHRLEPARCDARTEQRWARAFDKADRDDRDRRVMRGQVRNGADVRRAIQLGVIGRGQRR